MESDWAVSIEPDRVLRDLPKPPTLLVVPTAGEVMEVCQPAEVLLTPATPVTPVTVEALTSLHNMIKRDALASDERSQQRTQICVQKLTTAARISFAECSLLQDHNRF